MAEMTIGEAAEALGVSAETIRRWIRRGQLVSRRDARGHVAVEVLAGGTTSTRPESRVVQQPHRHGHAADPRRQLAHVTALLAEVRRQRDQLEAQVAAQSNQLELAAKERMELLRLLGAAQEQLAAGLRQPAEAGSSATRHAPAPGTKETG